MTPGGIELGPDASRVRARTCADMMPAPGRSRWRSCLRDYLAIVAGIMAVTAAGMLVRSRWPIDVSSIPLLLTDTVACGSTVLPAWVYLSVSEAGARQASWGKRAEHLRVVATPRGGAVRPRRVGLRNVVKLLPWQLAHIGVVRSILSVDAPALINTTFTLAIATPAVSLFVAWRDPQHRALHDLVAGTRVVLDVHPGSGHSPSATKLCVGP